METIINSKSEKFSVQNSKNKSKYELLIEKLDFSYFGLISITILVGSIIGGITASVILNSHAPIWELVICSSVSMVFAIDSCKRKKRQAMLNWLFATIAGGVAFLSIQAYEYYHLSHAMGMTFSSYAHGDALFSSTFFAITGFHGLHVLSGVIYLITMYVHAYRGDFDNGDYNQLEIAGLFWHFVDLVWILVFTFIYLL
jgi:heme/copper-type cytochrome/quinol oxidase subunit 3